jgi:hypothetical protein
MAAAGNSYSPRRIGEQKAATDAICDYVCVWADVSVHLKVEMAGASCNPSAPAPDPSAAYLKPHPPLAIDSPLCFAWPFVARGGEDMAGSGCFFLQSAISAVSFRHPLVRSGDSARSPGIWQVQANAVPRLRYCEHACGSGSESRGSRAMRDSYESGRPTFSPDKSVCSARVGGVAASTKPDSQEASKRRPDEYVTVEEFLPRPTRPAGDGQCRSALGRFLVFHVKLFFSKTGFFSLDCFRNLKINAEKQSVPPFQDGCKGVKIGRIRIRCCEGVW